LSVDEQGTKSGRLGGDEMLRIGVVAILVVLLTGVAFVGGFLTGGIVSAGNSGRNEGTTTSGSNPPATRPAPGGAPGATPGATPGAPAGDPTSFELFWDVWGLLQDEYYGELPDEQQMTYGAIRGVLGTLDDDFTSFIEPEIAEILRQDATGSFEGIGALVRINDEDRLEIVRPFAEQPAAEAGVQAGDIVTHVDGDSIAGLGIYEAISLIRGPAGSSVTLTLERQGVADPFDVTITRAAIEIPLVEARMLDEGVGYIALSQFSSGATEQLNAALDELLAQNPKGVILDLRDNPGGFLREAISVSDVFLPEGVVVIERRRDGPDEIYSSENGQTGESVPLIVLINKGSASASEIVAGALQDRDRAQLVGETTFGKGSVQIPHELSDGSELRITIARWFTPDDRAIHGTGLEPDVAISNEGDNATPADDEQLQQAIELLLGAP
jgi:carboxyl-terminal processing protease